MKAPPEQKTKAILWMTACVGIFLFSFYETGKFTYIPDGTAGYYYMLAFVTAVATIIFLVRVIYLFIKR